MTAKYSKKNTCFAGEPDRFKPEPIFEYPSLFPAVFFLIYVK